MSDQITYDDKADLIVDTTIDNIFKVTASDMNEIKSVVNAHADDIDELNAPEKWVSVGTTAPTDGRRVWFKKGKNLYNTSIKTSNSGSSNNNIVQDTSNKLEIQGVSQYYSGIYKKYQLKPNTQYTISTFYSDLSNSAKGIIYYKLGDECEQVASNNKDGYKEIGTTRTSLTIETDSTGLVAILFICNWTANNGHIVYNEIMLEEGSTATTYEPYVEQGIYVDEEEWYSKPKVLWTNPNPTSVFASQTITLGESITNYKYYEVLYKTYKDENIGYNTGKIPVEWSTNLYGITNASDGGVRSRMRSVTINSSTQIEISSCSLINTKGDAYTYPDDTRLIPFKILGYKE